MRISPEFQRNIWLELSSGRLIMMPLILGGCFFLSYVADDYALASKTAATAKTLFILITLVWGTKLSSESVMNEVRDHTWDWQRMSVLTPWDLTLGKLLGATIYAWYGAGICLLAFLVSSTGENLVSIGRTCLALVSTGVFAQAVSLLASMTALRKDRRYYRGQTSAFLVLGIMAAGPFIGVTTNMKDDALTWFVWSFNVSAFMLCTLVLYTAWAVIGINRLMRSELRMKNMPWVWFSFVLFNMILVSGFFGDKGIRTDFPDPVSSGMSAAFAVAGIATYFMALSERKDFLILRNLKNMIMESNWEGFLSHSPRWLLTLPLAIVTGIGLIPVSAFYENKPGFIWFVVSVLFFMLRDILIIVFCNLGLKNKKPDIAAVVCLGLLYGLFPAISLAMKLEPLTLLFWPRTDLYPWLGTFFSIFEFMVLVILVARRWKKQETLSDSGSKRWSKAGIRE